MYTSLVKYQILKRRKKRSQQPLAAFLACKVSRKGLHAAVHDESWKRSGTEGGHGVVQTRLCGTPCFELHSELQDFIPFAFLAGSCSIVQVQNGKEMNRQVRQSRADARTCSLSALCEPSSSP